MAEAITVSSSSSVLRSSDTAPIDVKPAKQVSSASCSAKKKATKASDTSGVTKRKQSKSRNGCVSCKAKRLKCDERHPSCKQCERRAITCGGYAKDYKWKHYDELNTASKAPVNPRQGPTLQTPTAVSSQFQGQYGLQEYQYTFGNPPHPEVYYSPHQHSYPFTHGPPIQAAFPHPPLAPMGNLFTVPTTSPFIISQSISPVESYAPGSFEPFGIIGPESTTTARVNTNTDSSLSPGQSPRIVDLLLPGTDLNVPPEEYSSFVSQHEAFYQPSGMTPPAPLDGDVDEEVVRDKLDESAACVMWLPSPTTPSSSGSSSNSPDFKIPAQLHLSMTSAESLTRRYHRDTCGVLSLKDGPTENPWRTLIWPLTRDCPALYHAIASMTSFHQARDMPTLRIQGIDHMRSAVHALAAGLQNMRVDAAISTTLVLAFAESWDQHISTGINHIKGAKILINQALMNHRLMPKQGEEWARLKFLCNTWIYMDVLARLTSADEDDAYDVDNVRESIYAAGDTDSTLDPLMGCAHTLFPIIGRVANLVRKVRRSDSNGPTIISQAVQLKSQLEEWTPPSHIEEPEDETTSPQDAIKTAIAYQYATLLYLHQAVPEVPSQPPGVLANKVLCALATVHPRSRSIIVHIYPLMAAGCEMTEPDDREWVKDRWSLMSTRMKLGIIERCLEVTKEVWNRRDNHAFERTTMNMEHLRSDSFSSDASIICENDACPDDYDADRDFGSRETPYGMPIPSGTTDPQNSGVTVKSRLHWLSVMKEWEWEVLLG